MRPPHPVAINIGGLTTQLKVSIDQLMQNSIVNSCTPTEPSDDAREYNTCACTLKTEIIISAEDITTYLARFERKHV